MEDSPVPPPNAVSSAKLPPPEKPEAASLRSKIVWSFWGVIVLLGIPTWLKTTSIYRANLPLQDMTNWADGVVSIEHHDRALLALMMLYRILPLPCHYTYGFPLQVYLARKRRP